MKAQVIIEYFIVIGVLIVLTLPIIAMFFSEYNSLWRETNNYNSVKWLIELDSDIKNIKYQGNGSYIVKTYQYPTSITSISISRSGNITFVAFNISNYGQIVMKYPFDVIITSNRWEGKLRLNISNNDGVVKITKIS